MIQTWQDVSKESTFISSTKHDQVTRSYYLCFLLYFLQGTVQSIPATMPYLYPELPPYTTLALFSMTSFPFSMKFLLSPFLEKYTHFAYGKRKTWIVISQVASFFTLFAASAFTELAQAHLFSIIIMVSTVLLTIQDISLDSLSIKQIRCPEKTSIVQSVAQSFGLVVGSLVLLKFTSAQFANKIGLQAAIATPTSMIDIIAVSLMLASAIVHFIFKETEMDSQMRGKDKSICEIISYSTTFFSIKSKYCRLGIFFLVYYQGFNFYEAGYDYQMIKHGFSRDTSNTLSNVIAAVVVVLTFKITELISHYGVAQSLKFVLMVQSLVYLFNVIVFSQSPYLFMITQFLSQILIASKNMVLFIYIYKFPLHGFSGMFITFLLSIWNLGELKALNTLIISWLGWRGCALFGVLLQTVIIGYLQGLLEWIEEGTIELDQSILEEEDKNQEQSAGLSTFMRQSQFEGF